MEKFDFSIPLPHPLLVFDFSFVPSRRTPLAVIFFLGGLILLGLDITPTIPAVRRMGGKTKRKKERRGGVKKRFEEKKH